MSKLYCTATSEKASKGQGGNEFLNIFATADGEMVVDISIEDYNKDEWKVRIDLMGEVYFRTTPKTKGKRQKGKIDSNIEAYKDMPKMYQE